MFYKDCHIKAILLAGLMFCSPLALAQITIAPTNLFISSENKFGTYMVINGSNQNQEISINFYFAYGKLDESGEREIIENDTNAETFSIADDVRAFPQNFVLAPGQRQIIRLRVNASNDLDDGTYWARIETTSSAETPPVESTSEEAVNTNISIKFRQVTGIFYKKGDVTTGIDVEEIRTEEMEDDRLAVLTDFRRTGNSPFLGSITTTLKNSKNETVRETFVSTSLYFDGTHRAELSLENIPSGNYTIQVKFEASRSDISSNDIIPMETVTESIPYTIR